MPRLKIDYIVSFSSEDPAFPASNLLLDDPSKKWKCQKPGERSAIVILQLQKASIISSIDIGNEHSAYIEVLVSRAGAEDDYKVLLSMSSFMTPLESRQETNPHQVRMFANDQLSKPECNEKWDRVKLICSQPFNRHVQYGISFINLFTPMTEQDIGNMPVVKSPVVVGNFPLRQNSSSEELQVGSLYSKLKHQQPSVPVATVIRQLTETEDESRFACSSKLKFSPNSSGNSSTIGNNTSESDRPKTTTTNRSRSELFYTDEDNAKVTDNTPSDDNWRDTSIGQLHKKDKNKNASDNELSINGIGNEAAHMDSVKKRKLTDDATDKMSSHVLAPSATIDRKKRKFIIPDDDDDDDDDDDSERKRTDRMKFVEITKSPTLLKKVQKRHARISKPFNRLMENVIFVISGIVNPDRAMLRSQAMAMGAKYKADWNNMTCTHLICAFMNTPKFSQVRKSRSGKIVKRSWIEECHRQRKLLPWRRFALDPADAKKPESDDEIEEQQQLPPASMTTVEVHEDVERRDVLKENEREEEDEDDHMNQGYDDSDLKLALAMDDHGSQKPVQPTVTHPDENINDDIQMETVSTCHVNDKCTPKRDLPIFFQNKIFYIDESYQESVKKLMERYITAYKGPYSFSFRTTMYYDSLTHTIVIPSIITTPHFSPDASSQHWKNFYFDIFRALTAAQLHIHPNIMEQVLVENVNRNDGQHPA